MAGQIVDLCLLAPSASGTPYQLFARQWLIDHKPREQGDANAPEWRQLFAASAFTALRTVPPAEGSSNGVVRRLSEHVEPIPFERGMVARGYTQLVDNGVVTDGWRPWPLHASPTVARVRYWRAADQGVEQGIRFATAVRARSREIIGS